MNRDNVCMRISVRRDELVRLQRNELCTTALTRDQLFSLCGPGLAAVRKTACGPLQHARTRRHPAAPRRSAFGQSLSPR